MIVRILFDVGNLGAVLDASGNYYNGSTLQYCVLEYGGLLGASGTAAVTVLGSYSPFFREV